MNSRDISLDFLRGMGMILVVLGHTASVYTDFIYLFHVPLFFIVSGVLFRHTDSMRMDIYKKWKRLYLPNLKYGLLFLALHNVFVSVGFYDSERYYGLIDFLKSAVKVVCWGNEQLGGAMWFLRSLFFAYCLWLAYTLCKSNLQKVVFAIIVVCLGWCVTYEDMFFSVRTLVTIPCIIFPYILIGEGKIILHINSLLDSRKWYPSISLLVSMVILLLLARFISVDLAYLKLPNPLLYYITPVVGLFLLLSINHFLQGRWLQKAIVYVGKHSIPILALHFLCFKLFTFLLNICCGQDFSLLDFPMPSLPEKVLLPLIYTLIGTGIPLCIDFVYNHLKQKIINRL